MLIDMYVSYLVGNMRLMPSRERLTSYVSMYFSRHMCIDSCFIGMWLSIRCRPGLSWNLGCHPIPM